MIISKGGLESIEKYANEVKSTGDSPNYRLAINNLALIEAVKVLSEGLEEISKVNRFDCFDPAHLPDQSETAKEILEKVWGREKECCLYKR